MLQLRIGLACALVAAASLLAMPAYGVVIGTDDFSYPDGSIDTLSGGTGWDWDNTTQTHTGSASDWEGPITAPLTMVSGGALVTSGGSIALRQYNGPTEGVTDDTNPSDERLGALRGTGKVYYSVQYTQNGSLNSWSGISSYDFGTERIFWGQPGGQGNFGIHESGVGQTNSSKPVVVGQTYQLVTELDFDNDALRLWVDPSPADANHPLVTRAYTPTNWSTAVRLASGGTTTWDDLAVATEWEDILPAPAASATLVNPGFEDGSTGWTSYNWTDGGGGAFVSGNYFGMMPSEGNGFWADVHSYDSFGNHKGVFQRVTTVPGEQYTLTADVQAFGNAVGFAYLAGSQSINASGVPGVYWDVQAQIGVDTAGGVDPEAATATWNPAGFGNGEDTGAMWRELSLDFTATADVTTIFLDGWPKWAFPGNFFAFDNVQLTGGGGPSGLILDVALSGSGLAPEGAVIETGGFGEDALAFTDRTHEWNSDPGQPTIDELGLTGADYIRFANDDRSPTDFMADVELAEGTKDLYLLIDQRISDANVQNILNGNAFVDTGVLIGVDESGDGDIDNTSRLFLLEDFTGASIMLGPQGQGGTNMYGFVATAGAAAVPEPSTWALLVLGGAGLLLWRRRRAAG